MGLKFDRSNMYWATALVIVFIGITADKALYFGHGFTLCGFFYQGSPTF